MNRKILWKDALSSLNHSWGRFIGIMLLMAVSAFAFIGLKMSGPDMKNTAQTYYQEVNLADLTVSSNYGLDKKDTQTIKKRARNATLDFGYVQDATINNSKTSLRVLSESKNISTNQLISGHFPKKDNQIAISYLLKNKYHLGEWITLNEHSNLKNSRFKIVGFIQPSEYTDKSNLGQSNVGNGQLSGVAVVKKSAFKAQNYSIARIRFNKTKELDPYSSTYQKFIDNKKERLTNSLKQNSKFKKTEINNNFKAAQKQIDQAKEQIQFAENNGLDMNKEKEKLEKQQTKLNEQKQEIKQLGSVAYYVNDRKNDSGYDTYQSNSEKIELITNIFPVFLFAVAALVSFSTMTRFIDSDVYQKYFGQKAHSNAQLIKLKNKNQTNSFASSLMKTGAVSAINLNTNNQQIIDSLIQSMNKVMFLLIGLAVLLAVVVIFTLTTTNLEERMREIATLKVLGFYNNEANLYIYRETIILSIFGILIGYLIGNWLHGFIIDNLAPLNAMFKPGILFSNYLLSALIPSVITGIMAIFVNRKIKDINMLEALKSVD